MIRKYYEIMFSEDLVEGIQPVYTEFSFLCLKPNVLLIQRGNKYYISEMKNRALDFKDGSIRSITPNIYISFASNNVIKCKGLRYNGYKGKLEDGKETEIMELLDDNAGRYIASVKFDNQNDYKEFKKPSFFKDEIKSISDFERKGIVLQKGLK